jgi:hypothetical protein
LKKREIYLICLLSSLEIAILLANTHGQVRKKFKGDSRDRNTSCQSLGLGPVKRRKEEKEKEKEVSQNQGPQPKNKRIKLTSASGNDPIPVRLASDSNRIADLPEQKCDWHWSAGWHKERSRKARGRYW